MRLVGKTVKVVAAVAAVQVAACQRSFSAES